MQDVARIAAKILRSYPLPVRGYHGPIHWARVFENGLRLVEATGADPEIVMLFALFHDSRRLNEGHDHQHGLRGAEFARSLHGTHVHLDDRRFELLFDACRLHTDGITTGDATLLACWDADRLDLGRVGIAPQPDRLCTDAAREMIAWADERAVRGHVPEAVLARWGIRSSSLAALHPSTLSGGIRSSKRTC